MKIYSIGRSGTNDLVIGDRSVSRRHAELRVDHGRFHLVDLGSTNGTYVRDGNDWAKIDQAYVAADERIMLGDTVTTVGALLAGRIAPADGPDMSIKSGAAPPPGAPRQVGDLAPQSYQAYLRQQQAAGADAPAPAARPSRLPVILLTCAVVLLLAVGVWVAVRFWDQLRPLIERQETVKPAPVVATSWERVLGGAGDDAGHAIARTPDGGFVVAGSTASKGAGNADLWLVRLDGAGNTLWDKTFGGDQDDIAYAVEALDDGYAVAGVTEAASGKNRTAWLLRLDASGTRQWEDRAGVSDGYRAVRRAAGGFVLAGTIGDQDKRNAWVVALDAKGQNAKPFVHSKGRSTASDVQPVGDQYVAVGTLDSTGKGRPGLYVVKLDARLKPVWERTFRGRDNDAYSHVLPLADGGFLVAGTTERTDRAGAPAGSGRITRLDGGGNKLWDKLIGRGKMETINAVAPAGAHGYVLAGSIVARGGASEDAWLVKIDGDGKIVWERRFGGDGADRLDDLKALPEGGFVAVGTTASKGAGKAELWVMRLDAEGQLATGDAAAKAPTKEPDTGSKTPPESPRK